MNPLTIAQWLAALGGVGGLFMHDNPAQQFANHLKTISPYFTPQAIGNSADAFYKKWLSGPQYSAAQGNAISQANIFRNSYARNVGAAGASGSGIAHTGGALADSLYGGKLSDIQSAGYSQAMQTALDALKAKFGVAGGIPQPSFGAPQQYGSMLQALSQFINLYSKGGNNNNPTQPYNPNYPSGYPGRPV